MTAAARRSPPRAVPRALALVALAAGLAGCAGPSYAGGPTGDDPHGVVIPGRDVTLWEVDGRDVPSRSGRARVAPGRRRLKVRLEFPLASDAWQPFEYREVELLVVEGHQYLLERTGEEGPFGPYELGIRERGPR